MEMPIPSIARTFTVRRHYHRRAMVGVFITRGMTVGFPELTLTMGDDGKITSNFRLHVRFDVCPSWVQLALGHLASAQNARAHREAVWVGIDEEAKAQALEREFECSMQAVMASAIALDAFYAILQQHVVLSPSVTDKWRVGRTSRYTQVAEVVRRAFSLKPKSAAALRSNIKEIYRLRDLAVHPSGKIEAPVLHPELNLGVEWRFATYRALNAEQVVNGTSWILWELSHNGKPKDLKIAEYMSTLRSRLEMLYPNGHPREENAKPP